MLERSYTRTEAGRAEIKARALPLSRSVRNLLLMIDGSKSAAEWLGLVQGTAAADIDYLLSQGLIAPVSSAAGPTPAALAGSTAASSSPNVGNPGSSAAASSDDEVSTLDYPQLYAYLTRHAKQYLGLMKGYRMVLELERCTDLPTLQQLAQRFVQDVSKAQGPEVAEQVRRALAVKGR